MNWLIYLSRPTVPAWPSTILDIARAAELRNPAIGVSGMLVFSVDFYLQYIEGEQAELTALWQDIEADERHAVLWVVHGDAPDRSLAGLPMGYFDADRESGSAASGLLSRDRLSWRAEQADELRRLAIELACEKYPALTGANRPRA